MWALTSRPPEWWDVGILHVSRLICVVIFACWNLYFYSQKKVQIPAHYKSVQPSTRVVRCWDTPCQGRGRCWRRIGGQLFQSGPFQTFPLQSLNKTSVFQQKCQKHGSNREAQEEDLDLVQKNTWSPYLQQTDQKNWSFALEMYFLTEESSLRNPQLLLIVFPTPGLCSVSISK